MRLSRLAVYPPALTSLFRAENKLNYVFFVSFPAAVIAKYAQAAALAKPLSRSRPLLRLAGSSSAVFWFSMAALCPLAERLGFVTEQLASYTNSTVGGLLNATFGNAPELIVSLFAIRANLLRVVQLSLLGSVFSNMLLVLGTAFLVGGSRYTEQRFKVESATTSISLLLVAALACVLCSALAASGAEAEAGVSVLALSRIASLFLLGLYLSFLYFQLKTHAHLFEDEEGPPAEEEGAAGDAAHARDAAEESVAEDEEEVVFTFRACLLLLAIVTVLVALLSDWIVGGIEVAAVAWGIPLPFISTILLPIVGNAAEHASAIIFARKNKLDIAIGIAVGSSTQIAVGVMPLCVLLAGAAARPLTLDMLPFESVALLVSVAILWQATAEGRSHWLKGLALMITYVILAAAFWLKRDVLLEAETPPAFVAAPPLPPPLPPPPPPVAR